MMACENNHQSGIRPIGINPAPASLPSTPNFVRKFHSNFRPLDLRKLTLYGGSSPPNGHSGPSNPTPTPHTTATSTEESSSPSPGSGYSSQSCSSSQDSSPRTRHFASCYSHDSFILKRQSSQNRLRESLLASLLLSPRSKYLTCTFFSYLYTIYALKIKKQNFLQALYHMNNLILINNSSCLFRYSCQTSSIPI